jgi:hypothetical protein
LEKPEKKPTGAEAALAFGRLAKVYEMGRLYWMGTIMP